MIKLPSMQFYPGDWMKDPAVRSVCLAARGLWMDMLCLMHESDRRGHLQHVTGQPVTHEQLARMTGCQVDEVSRLLQELEDSGVYSKSEDGVIYCRRIVRDERKRRLCSDAGKRGGGNPGLKGQPKGDIKGDRKGVPKQNTNPSSSSSSSKLISVSDLGGLNGKPSFEIFYSAFPRKQHHDEAWQEWVRMKPDKAMLDQMLEAIDSQKQSDEWQQESGRWIPCPDKWLRDRQWEAWKPEETEEVHVKPGEEPEYEIIEQDGYMVAKKRS